MTTTRTRVAHIATVDLTLRFLLFPQMKRLVAEGFDVTAISAPGPWTDDLESAGISFIPWTRATRSWDLRADVAAFAELTRILRGGRFDIVHTHNPKPGLIGRVAAGLTGGAVVNTVHGFYATPEDRRAKRVAVMAAERIAGLFSDAELYQSEEDLHWARATRLVRRSKMGLLGNGTDTTYFHRGAVPMETTSALRSELGIPSDAFVIGAVGRLVAEKGYRELFAAFRAIRATVPAARLLVVGQRDDAKSDALTEDEIADAARDGVVFAGWREDVRDLLAMMDAFVLASWREGVPRSAIEAAAMATPLVLTDIRGCREIVRDGIDGILVRVRDETALAAALVRLATDDELRTRLGRAARARAADRFNERVVEERILSTYRSLSKVPQGASPGVDVRPARTADAMTLGRLHRHALPTAFLPTLGDRFMERLYRALIADREAVTVVAEQDGTVVGFASGVASVERFYSRFYRRHGMQAAIVAIPRLVRPTTIKRAIETARYSSRTENLPDSELLAIAVDKSCRATGVGKRLVADLIDGLDELGATDVKVVVSADNSVANTFYERVGFAPATQIVLHDRLTSNVWVKPCRS